MGDGSGVLASGSKGDVHDDDAPLSATRSVEPSMTDHVTLWDWDDDGVSLSQTPDSPLESSLPRSSLGVDGAPFAPTIADPVHDTAPVVGPPLQAFPPVTEAIRLPAAQYRLRRLPGSDLSIFPVVLGGVAFGWTAAGDQSMAVLEAYAEAGGNAIDTAGSYSSGRSEILIGNWLRDRGDRDRFVVSTKIGRRHSDSGLGAHAIIRSTEESLERLRVDTIDILYFQADDPAVPLEETLTAADSLVRSGKVRYIAASGFRPERLMEARVIAGQLVLPKFLGVQLDYNLLGRRAFEAEMSPVARAQDLAVLASSPLARGFLGGGYRARRGPRGAAAPAKSTQMAQHMTKRGFRVLDTLDAVAKEHDVAPATVALAWLLTKPLLTAPVASASSAEQVADIVRAPSVHLTRAQVSSLDRVSSWSVQGR